MTDSGVVDRIQVPPWLRAWAEQAWRETPPIARAFLGLAMVDVLGRSFGLLAPHLGESLHDPLALFASFVPHDLWILLPAVLVLRRPDAPTATPLILWGAVVVAVVEFLVIPVRSLFGSAGTLDGQVASEWLALTGLTAVTVGRVMLGRGLAVLNTTRPTLFVEGLSNIVVLTIAAEALTWLFQLATSPVDLGDATLNSLITWNGFGGIAALLGWGFVLRAVVRADGDPTRDALAITIAAAGAVLGSVAGLLDAITTVVSVATGATLGIQPILSTIAWTDHVFAPALVLAAFFIGLAEPPFPLPVPEQPIPTEPAVETEAPGEAEIGADTEPTDAREPRAEA